MRSGRRRAGVGVVDGDRARRHRPAHAGELLQPAHDLGAVLGGALDDLQRPGGALVDGPAPEELDAPDHDRQEVVEVMGGAAGQPAERPQRLTLDQALLHGAQVAERALRVLVQVRVVERDGGVIGERPQEGQPVGRVPAGRARRATRRRRRRRHRPGPAR